MSIKTIHKPNLNQFLLYQFLLLPMSVSLGRQFHFSNLDLSILDLKIEDMNDRHYKICTIKWKDLEIKEMDILCSLLWTE